MSRAGSTTRDRTRGAPPPPARNDGPTRSRGRLRVTRGRGRDERGRGRDERGRGRGRGERTPHGSAPVTPLRARRRRGALTRRRKILLAVAGLVGLAGVAVLLWAGPVLAVRTVRVDGARTLPVEQVQEAAGVATGTPLLQVDVGAAEARVARLPQVASVEVDRGWPSSVVITVVERTPVAVIEEAGRRTLVDGEGVPFDTITGEPPSGVVVLDVTGAGPDDPATEAALAAITALPAGLRPGVERVSATSAVDVTLALAGGTTVRWGTGDRSAEKARVLVALLRQTTAGGLDPADELDVSTPDAVVLR